MKVNRCVSVYYRFLFIISGILKTLADITGKLDQICTDFEVKCRKSARNIGIDHSLPMKSALGADHYASFL